ncbi:MAG: M48 family metallopeptidase [Oscillospiraceae bacterium]|nr:M48 family metallopeptidase [Candidatus Ruminococcus equi]
MSLEVKESEVIVRAPLKMSKKQIESFVSKNEGWIKKKLAANEKQSDIAQKLGRLSDDEINTLIANACEYIPKRVAMYAKIIGVYYGKISIKNQRARWGSCSKDGNLNFNCLLMLTPPEVIDSVVVHELCHRKQMNHSKAFYDEVYKTYPQYDKWNKWLKDNGSIIIKRCFG